MSRRIGGHKRSSNYGSSTPSWHVSNVVKGVDAFAGEIPSFNLKGEIKVKTVMGGLFTLATFALILAYGTMKAVHLMERRNP